MLQFPLYLSFKYSRFKFQAIFNFWYSIIQVTTEKSFQFCFKVKSIGWKNSLWTNMIKQFDGMRPLCFLIENYLWYWALRQTSNSHDLNVVTNVGNIKKDFDVNHHHQSISHSSRRQLKLKWYILMSTPFLVFSCEMFLPSRVLSTKKTWPQCIALHFIAMLHTCWKYKKLSCQPQSLQHIIHPSWIKCHSKWSS